MPSAAPPWPKAFTLTTLDHVPPKAVHTLLKSTFADLKGASSQWHTALTSDAEYDAELALVAQAPDGTVAGYIQSWTSGFIKDLVVSSAYRRQGLASALMAQTFFRFASRGFPHIDLKVERSNKPAQKFYAGLGMKEVFD